MVEKKGNLANWFYSGKKRLLDVFSSKLPTNGDLIGLAITPSYINLLKINSTDSQYKVENFDMTALPQGAVVKNDIKDPATIAKILKKIFHHSGATSKNIVTCIPRSLVIMKNFTVNAKLRMDEIESKVWIEANRLFPNLVEDIYLDFNVTGPAHQDSAQLNVLVVACRKEFINPYLETLALAQLNAKIIDINYYAYERVLSLIAKQFSDATTIALLNVSFYYIDLIVMQEGNIIFTHEVGYDGSSLKQLTQKFIEQQQYAMATATAGGDASPSSNKETQLKNILNLGLGMQIKHTMQFFYTSRPNVRLQRVILSGDCTLLIPDLLKYVCAELGKDVILANPFKDMHVASRIDKDKLTQNAPALVLCCGTALRLK